LLSSCPRLVPTLPQVLYEPELEAFLAVDLGESRGERDDVGKPVAGQRSEVVADLVAPLRSGCVVGSSAGSGARLKG